MTAPFLAIFLFLIVFSSPVHAASESGGLPDPSSAGAIGWLILTVSALALSANQIMGGILNYKKINRGDMDASRSADARYASLNEVTDLRGRHDKLDSRVSYLERTTATELRAIHRALGRIEGELGTAPKSSEEG